MITVEDARRIRRELGDKTVIVAILEVGHDCIPLKTFETRCAPAINPRQATGILDGYEIGSAVPLAARFVLEDGAMVHVELFNRRVIDGH